MRVTSLLRRSFIAGVVLVAPLAITLFVFNILFKWLTSLVNPVVTAMELSVYTNNIQLLAQLVAIGLILVFLTLVGYVAQRGFGRRLFGRMGSVMNFIPLVSVIYGSVRQVADSLVERGSRYEDVVLVEYPHYDSYVLGFVTGDSPPAVDESVDESTRLVYLPNSPNPTAGQLLVVPQSNLHHTDLPVRQAIRMIVTTGMGESEQVELLPGRDPMEFDQLPASSSNTPSDSDSASAE